MSYDDPARNWTATDRAGARLALRRALELRVGWKRMGVRGWVHRAEAERLISRRLDEQLPLLARAGEALRVDVRETGRQRPEWIYRLTELGEQRGRGGTRRLRVPEPQADPEDEGLFLMPAGPWEVLAWMRTGRAERRGGEVRGERGWLESLDLTWDLPHAGRDDLAALTARGWLERIPRPGTEQQRSRRYLYRATDRAMALRVNDRATELFVDLRIGSGKER